MFQSPGMAVMQPKEADATTEWETIEELFAALESPLLAYAFRLVRDAGVAEDMVQDAFMKLHAQFALVTQPRRWLYRTVHNQSLNHLRQAGKVVPLAGPAGDGEETATGETRDASPWPDEVLARWEGIDLVRTGVAGLDERGRELVRLRFHEELSYAEISERTGLKVGHVGYLLHHALKTVGDGLARNGLVP